MTDVDDNMQPQARPAGRLPDDLRMLMYWLANEDIYTSETVRQWMERNPPDLVKSDLSRIAALAQPEPRSFWYGLFTAFMIAFGTSDAVTEKGAGGRKAGIRAALLLANMDDPRAFAPLVRVFETEWSRKGKYQDAIEGALLRLLVGEHQRDNLAGQESLVFRLAEKIWESGRSRSDLSPRLTELLSASLHRLAEIDPRSQLLVQIARSSARPVGRTQAREIAKAVLAGTE